MVILSKRHVEKQRNGQVWIEEEGNRKVVNVANSLASSLKEEVSNSFVATVNRMDVTEDVIKNWIGSAKGIQAGVKHINFPLFWIVPLSKDDFSLLIDLD